MNPRRRRVARQRRKARKQLIVRVGKDGIGRFPDGRIAGQFAGVEGRTLEGRSHGLTIVGRP